MMELKLVQDKLSIILWNIIWRVPIQSITIKGHTQWSFKEIYLLVC